jgi:hypothetical protein
MLFIGALRLKVYSTLDFSWHLLSKSTLLNNYSVMYIVNNVQILNKGTFIKELLKCTIEARSSSLLVISHSTCTIKSILNKKNNKVDLVLRNVVMVKGFHMNIMFEALLYKKGV